MGKILGGKDIPFVFLHGITGSRRNFERLEGYFPNSRSLDLIGFGTEKKPETTYDTELFMTFLGDKIKEPCVLVGHSMGAILAKEFALRNPRLVKRLYLINYPLDYPAKIERDVRKNPFLSMYIDGRILSRLLCNTKVVYKFFLVPFGLIRFRGYFRSFWDSFSHTYTSCSSTLRNVVLTEDYRTLLPLRGKAILITGTKDKYTNLKLLGLFRSYRIPDMNHRFFGYEAKIAEIIRHTIATPAIYS